MSELPRIRLGSEGAYVGEDCEPDDSAVWWSLAESYANDEDYMAAIACALVSIADSLIQARA